MAAFAQPFRRIISDASAPEIDLPVPISESVSSGLRTFPKREPPDAIPSLISPTSTFLCGPSFGNNANNRCEEAIGSAHDFRKAQSEGLFGRGAAPFLGYFIFVEDAPASRSPVTTASPHFPADKCFQGASYQTRMRIHCERMVENQLYSAASALAASPDGDGSYRNLSGTTSFQSMLARLDGYLSGEPSAAAADSAVVREDEVTGAYGLLAGDFFESLDEG